MNKLGLVSIEGDSVNLKQNVIGDLGLPIFFFDNRTQYKSN